MDYVANSGYTIPSDVLASKFGVPASEIDEVVKSKGFEATYNLLKSSPKASAPVTGGDIKTVSVGNTTAKVSSQISDKLASADADFYAATGKHLQINQSYRTTEQQAKLYAELKPKGARVAPPGKSFHEKGLAIDVTNWKEAEKYLRKYGLVNDLADDKGHFSYGETNKA